MITRIKLRNWKSHLDSELSFSKGVNALIGIMGSGKTSVMQAIAFALFGTFSGISSRRLSLDDLIMSKPQAKDEASVEIEFVLDGKKYVVKRTIERERHRPKSARTGSFLRLIPRALSARWREYSRWITICF
jgi:exonuclease SbcC